MSTQEQVSFITRFELLKNGLTPLLLILYAGALLILFASDRSLAHSMIGDIIFLSLFSGSFTLFARASLFKPLILNNHVMLTYPVLVMQTLPIKREAIAHSRLIINNVYNLLIQSCFIIPYFAFIPSFRGLMSVQTFFVFCVIWMSLGIFVSGSAAAQDAGRLLDKRKIAAHIRFVLLMILLAALFICIHMFTPYTLIEGTIYLAKTWPFLVCVVSFSLAYVGIFYGKRKIIKALQTTDYV